MNISPYIVPGLKVKVPPTFANIVEAVSNYYSIDVKTLRRIKRNNAAVMPRYVCMYFLRKYTYMSLVQISTFFHYKDHTSTVNACNAIKGYLKVKDQVTVTAVQDIEKVFINDGM
jgi:chromosomal replication initiator protein